MAQLRRNEGGSSSYATRALLMDEAPSIDAGEITDKGYINQRAVLQKRSHLVEALYAGEPGAEIIVLTPDLETGRV
jgi:feruloyl-CoA synthase